MITGCPTPPRLIGNYRSERWATFTERYPPESNGYELTLPAPGEHGIEVIVGT